MTQIVSTGTRALRKIWNRADNDVGRRSGLGWKRMMLRRLARLGPEEAERRYREAVERNKRNGIAPFAFKAARKGLTKTAGAPSRKKVTLPKLEF